MRAMKWGRHELNSLLLLLHLLLLLVGRGRLWKKRPMALVLVHEALRVCGLKAFSY
jgi:hypothetical protein